jgi:predicted nuclease of predicted toxin-antitoxin system
VIFLLDVHLPWQLAAFLIHKGHEAIHVLDILNKARTKDTDIRKHADLNGLILITKDRDFVTSHTLLQSPKKLIKINLGNVSNVELLHIFEKNWKAISGIIGNSEYMIELDRIGIVLHEPRE